MATLAYREAGSGNPLILLHGFCESEKIWNPLIQELSKYFRLILPDLPGHGQTPLLPQTGSLADIAADIIDLVKELDLVHPVVMGHSMGGYVTLAAVKQQPDLFKAFGLIHSTAFADTKEKKENRNKSIQFIERNGPDAFFDIFVPGLYHKEGPWINEVDAMVRKTPPETLIRFTEMMRDRPDSRSVIKTFKGRILLIGGKMDSFIPWETLEEQASTSNHTELHVIDHVGHLGMYEDPELIAGLIEKFLR
jgi:pimeloyl-ACP methyl ester carboxylesterase